MYLVCNHGSLIKNNVPIPGEQLNTKHQLGAFESSTKKTLTFHLCFY